MLERCCERPNREAGPAHSDLSLTRSGHDLHEMTFLMWIVDVEDMEDMKPFQHEIIKELIYVCSLCSSNTVTQGLSVQCSPVAPRPSAVDRA